MACCSYVPQKICLAARTILNTRMHGNYNFSISRCNCSETVLLLIRGMYNWI